MRRASVAACVVGLLLLAACNEGEARSPQADRTPVSVAPGTEASESARPTTYRNDAYEITIPAGFDGEEQPNGSLSAVRVLPDDLADEVEQRYGLAMDEMIHLVVVSDPAVEQAGLAQETKDLLEAFTFRSAQVVEPFEHRGLTWVHAVSTYYGMAAHSFATLHRGVEVRVQLTLRGDDHRPDRAHTDRVADDVMRSVVLKP